MTRKVITAEFGVLEQRRVPDAWADAGAGANPHRMAPQVERARNRERLNAYRMRRVAHELDRLRGRGL